jgi:heptosyltransferase-3
VRRLLIRPGAIGDCILSFPALEHLAGSGYTEIWISQPVVPLIQFADKVLPLSSTGLDLFGVGDLPPEPELVSKLRSFDHIVSWYGTNRPEFREAMRSLCCFCEFHPALPPRGYAQHASRFYAEQTGANPGVTPQVRATQSPPRQTVVIQPFSGSAKKNWPLEAFRELACCLPLETEWCAGPEEVLPGAVKFDDLSKLASWMSGARLYIGNDSGITHLAAAMGLPTLALFGPTSTDVWAPRGKQVAVLHEQPIANLTVETVLAAANRLLRSR